MLFNSYEFLLLFLPVTLAALYLARRIAPLWVAIAIVSVASLVFYAAWDVRFLPVLIVSIVANYTIGNLILTTEDTARRRVWLVVGLAANLAALGYFKYAGFFLDTIASVAGLPEPVVSITLPIGISFFTFTQIAFLVDAFRGQRGHRYSPLNYLLFVTFFPHLIAGPILIHAHVIPQFESERFGRPSARTLYSGAVFICCGMFKKVIVADTLATYVNTLYDSAGGLSMSEAWLAAFLYTFQLYFDFSGYSDMAVGLARLMNVRIPINFNSPYKSASIIEFWRRWHISLSSFLRRYLYFSLGGNRKGPSRQMVNLFVTMLLGGLWHGAGWTFVVWGAAHGAALVVNHQARRLGLRWPRPIGWALTLLFVVAGWVIFRAATMSDATAILGAMVGICDEQPGHNILGDNETRLAWAAVGLLAWCVLVPPTRWFAVGQTFGNIRKILPGWLPQRIIASSRRPSIALAIVFGLMLAASVIYFANPTEFLYFQF